MIRKLIKRIKLYLDPPKTGDVYYGDTFDFIVGNSIEYVLHGMRDREGDVLWCTIPGRAAYRLTIELDVMPYYRCTSEVLAYSKDGSSKKWLTRSQPRRICKKKFVTMIVEGRLEKR